MEIRRTLRINDRMSIEMIASNEAGFHSEAVGDKTYQPSADDLARFHEAKNELLQELAEKSGQHVVLVW